MGWLCRLWGVDFRWGSLTDLGDLAVMLEVGRLNSSLGLFFDFGTDYFIS